jgi:cell division protein FtsQ
MLFTRRHINPKNLKLSGVDMRRMEKLARTNPWVASAQAYVDNRRVLHVRVTQRVPVVRLFGRDGSSHYLDTALKTLPVSVGYAHYIPVVTGVPSLLDDSAGRAMKGQIVGLVNRISRDSFWNAQVAEIAVSPDGRGFELVPVLGSHRILLGDTGRLDAKLKGLFSFYKGVLNRVGWDKYTILDVRYRGQVVASPALAWKAPVDRAATNMNWVKTILGEEPTATTSASSTVSTSSAAAMQAARTTSPAAVPLATPQTHPVSTPAARPAAAPNAGQTPFRKLVP